MYSVSEKTHGPKATGIMKLLTYVIFCVIVLTGLAAHPTTKKPQCEGVLIDGKHHKRRVLMNGLNRPYQLAIYNQEHQVFFSYNLGQDTQDTFGIAYVKINDGMPTEVPGIENGFALAIDEENKMIYFGGSKGIYQANVTKLDAVEHIVKDKDIWDIFYHKNRLYFIEFPSQFLYVYDIKEKNITRHEHKVEVFQFVIDKDDEIFVTTKLGLMAVKIGYYATLYTGPETFRAAEVNHKGEAYFAAKNGIYVPDKEKHELRQIATVKNIFGLTFDADDNIIYSNPHEIVKLLPRDCK